MSLASRKLIQATAGAAGGDTGDDDFANVVLLLDGDGTSGDQNETFTDSSTNGFTVTESGSVVQGSFSPYGNNWSNYFASADYLTIPTSADFTIGSSDYTVECWIQTTDASGDIVSAFNQSAPHPGWLFGIGFPEADSSKNGLLTFYSANSSNNETKHSTARVDDGSWHHVAISKSGTTLRFFIDGALDSTHTLSYTSTGSGQTIRIGTDNNATQVRPYFGYISNLRIVKGTAVYTSAFTPSSSPLTTITNTKLLISNTNSFKDKSSSSHTISVGAGTPKVTPFSPFKDDDARTLTTDGGSANFDSNEYLTIADNASLDVSGAMTAEIWVYFTDMPDANIGSVGSGYLFNRWTASGSQRSWGIFVGANGAVSFYVSNSGSNAYTISSAAAGSVGLYRWHHVAVSWDGSNQRLFIDGDLKATTANTSGPFSTSSAGVTVNSLNVSTTGTNMNAYYSDARYFASAAIYTSSFTPPTSPLTATSGSDTATVLLNFQDAGIYDLSGINNLDTVGNAQIDTAVVKYGTGSMQFDGSGDYIEAEYAGDLFDFGSADWTMECWVYLQADSDSAGGIIEIYKDDNNYIRLFRDGGPDIQLRGVSGGSDQFRIQSSAQSQDTWIHIAGVRDGSTIRLFVDGTQVGTDASFSIPDLSDARVVVGLDLAATDRYFTGYIDDLRITKGIARYTSNFTAPSEALPKF